MRWIVFIAMLTLTPVASAGQFSGADLLSLCRIDIPACGDFIRTSLRKQGWADRTPLPEATTPQRTMWIVCPPLTEDARLATTALQSAPAAKAGVSGERFVSAAFANHQLAPYCRVTAS